MPPAPPLDYAPTSHPRRRWRRILLISLFLSIAIVSWHFRHPILSRSKLLVAQYRCMHYAAPPDELVYEEDMQRGDQLIARDPAHYIRARHFPMRYMPVSETPACRKTPCWDALCDSFPAQVSNSSIGWSISKSGWYALPSPSDTGFWSIPIFLHQRRAKGGENRLIVIDLEGTHGYNLTARVIRPASLTKGPQVLSESDDQGDSSDLIKIARLFNDPNHLGIQLYAGQPDPADESRFTINACIATVNIKLQGQLLPNDTIQIEVPNGDQARTQILKILGKSP